MTKQIFGNLDMEAVKLTSSLHKKIIETIANVIYSYENEKQFEITMLSLALTVSGILSTLGIKDLDQSAECLDDFKNLILSIHNSPYSNNSYMHFNDSKKVTEGQFN